jgi:hypothetical protein
MTERTVRRCEGGQCEMNDSSGVSCRETLEYEVSTCRYGVGLVIVSAIENSEFTVTRVT